ncbi:MAG: D-glycero-beta-D-manno-heptose 1,7-bisphosphate 7-phosphatase [Lachnospiraceae bacterium]|jgi:D,D-heptose 1,7-bisphosphate phosphatase|nr:D-glycero-beta-D-manno-heptose 1,7-bisphosphate 7-phosphatase [Lachnospiraceae bacterium]
MEAVIMAGGKGTRLQSVAKDIPKPMIKILGKPLLEYQIDSLRESGIDNIILIIGYLGNIIQEYFADGTKFGVNIQYIIEEKPLGTAGALYYLKEKIQGDFVFVFGDLLLDIDWNRFVGFHKKNNGLITLYGHPNSHPYDSDVIVSDENNRVIKIEPKNIKRDFYYHNFVNAGIYCMSSIILDAVKNPEKTDLEKKIITEEINKGRVYAYRSTEYIKDIGTPKRLNSAYQDIKNGLLKNKNLKNKQKAIFLDRDGTINVLNGFLSNIDDFEFLPGIAEAIKKINNSEYLVIVATNQPVVARGECTLEKLEQIHMKMELELGKQGAYLDDLFYCPHHPDKGYKGENIEFKIDCNCRKPKTGMLKQAANKYNIDLKQSWFIGDTTMDIKTGINAGTKTILVNTGEAGLDKKYNVVPDYNFENLLQAVDFILSIK